MKALNRMVASATLSLAAACGAPEGYDFDGNTSPNAVKACLGSTERTNGYYEGFEAATVGLCNDGRVHVLECLSASDPCAVGLQKEGFSQDEAVLTALVAGTLSSDQLNQLQPNPDGTYPIPDELKVAAMGGPEADGGMCAARCNPNAADHE
ncbi:hypothetical protein IPJ72_06630 [Candidatus Peregrinibacteria bacterium]|nr:MAG: hypothetical protein IPJ72_06630 [Candidatus Peregrinibacteria bacterium]